MHQSTDIQCIMEPAVHSHSKSVLYDAGSDDFLTALLFCDENNAKDFTHVSGR